MQSRGFGGNTQLLVVLPVFVASTIDGDRVGGVCCVFSCVCFVVRSSPYDFCFAEVQNPSVTPVSLLLPPLPKAILVGRGNARVVLCTRRGLVYTGIGYDVPC